MPVPAACARSTCREEGGERSRRRASARTRALFDAGRPVCDGVEGRLRHELRATWLGGTRILDRLADVQYDVIRARPALGILDAPWFAWRMLTWQTRPLPSGELA